MKLNLTPYELALWAALPMTHTTRMEGRLRMILDAARPRRAVTRRVLMAALGIGAAVLIPLAMLRPAAHAQAAYAASAVPRRQQGASAETKDVNGYARRVLLLKYHGEAWTATHPDAVRRGAQIKPLRAAALYGSWAESYRGIRSGNTERFLRRAQAMEPNNPQWPDRLGDLYSLGMIHASPEVARVQAQKALAQYELAASLLGAGSGASSAMAVVAFDAGEYDKARHYAGDLLHRNEAAVDQTGGFPQDDERHHAHLILGRLALRDGDTAGAEAHLLAMGRVSGSPTLDTFGPNMQLAQDLLEHGERQPVLTYLDECDKFWKMGAHISVWRTQVQEGKTPDFGANLIY